VVLGAMAQMGCGGISPGEYEVFRVSFADTDQSSGCYFPDTGPGPNDASDSSTLRGSGTWIISAAVDDKLYLDTGIITLEGAESDNGYAFTGKVVNVEFDMPDGTGSKRTTTITSTVNVTTDGDAISGEAIQKTAYGCVGSTCGPKIETCTETTTFTGTRVDDVQLNYDIAPPK